MSTKSRKSGSVSSRRSSKSSVTSSKEEMVDVNVEESQKLNSIAEIATDASEDKSVEIGITEEDANSTETLTDSHDRSAGDSQTMEPLVIENDTDTDLEKRRTPEPEVRENGSPVLNQKVTHHRADFPMPKIPQEKFVVIESDLKLTQNTSVLIEKMATSNSVTEIKSTDIVTEVHTSEKGKISAENHNGDTGESPVDEIKQNGDDMKQEEVHSSTSDLNGHNDVHKSEQDYDTASDTSIVVNYSGNTTRNIDFSLTEEGSVSNNDLTNNSNIPDEYLDQSPRDLSYLKTLKIISGRKTLHDLRQTSFRNALKKNEALKYAAGSPKVGQCRSLKRRGDSDSFYEGIDALDYSKRLKRDENGLLSYVTNPISILKNKLSASPSTPQLRSYNPLLHETEDIERGEVNVENDKTNKWCLIQ